MASVGGGVRGWLFDCVEEAMPNSMCSPSETSGTGLVVSLVQFCSPNGCIGELRSCRLWGLKGPLGVT